MPSLDTRSLAFSLILAISFSNGNLVAAFPFFAYIPT